MLRVVRCSFCGCYFFNETMSSMPVFCSDDCKRTFLRVEYSKIKKVLQDLMLDFGWSAEELDGFTKIDDMDVDCQPIMLFLWPPVFRGILGKLICMEEKEHKIMDDLVLRSGSKILHVGEIALFSAETEPSKEETPGKSENEKPRSRVNKNREGTLE